VKLAVFGIFQLLQLFKQCFIQDVPVKAC